jgi:hypothetical protein
MKRIVRAALPVLVLLAAASPAWAAGWDGTFPYKIDAGANIYLKVYKYPQTKQQLGPWYLYWPLEAHFQEQAPLGGYPMWAPPYSLPPTFHAPTPTQIQQFQPPAPSHLPGFQPPAPTPLPPYQGTSVMPRADIGGR